jgi:hypothetical protein
MVIWKCFKSITYIVISDSGGFSLTSGSSAQIIENPDGDYTQELYTWYREQKPNMEIKTLSTGTDSSGAFGNLNFNVNFDEKWTIIKNVISDWFPK